MTLVSTVIPAYNAEAFVGETLESALAQTHRDHEIIVVDDGSTDGTLEILRGFADRIRVVRQSNGGPAAARNAGARLAQGEWLAFLDADDLWHPEKLQRQLSLAEQTGAKLVYTDRENIGDCGHVSKLQSDGVVLHQGDVFEQLLLGNFITLSSVLISRSLFLELGGFDESSDLKAVEDWELWIRAAATVPVGLCPEPLTKYRWHAAGISRDAQRMRRNLFHVLERGFALPRGKSLSRIHRNRARSAAWSVVGWEASRLSTVLGSRYFLNAALCDPLRMSNWKHLVKSVLGAT